MEGQVRRAGTSAGGIPGGAFAISARTSCPSAGTAPTGRVRYAVVDICTCASVPNAHDHSSPGHTTLIRFLHCLHVAPPSWGGPHGRRRGVGRRLQRRE